MAKLEGIIYKTFDHYVVLRGFAPIKDLANISHKPDSYQRSSIFDHRKEIVKFLNTGEYKYFPEVTLACRVNRYIEFASNIGVDNVVDRDDAQYVQGLKVLVERLPYDSYRARHANLTKAGNSDLVRVDGNHRLESFDNPKDPIWAETGANKADIEKLVVPYTVIFSEQEFGNKFEAGIFHNINFRQEPLRQEASLKIIHDLDVFDNKEDLGSEYPLALKLITIAEKNIFNNIFWLTNNDNTEKDYYRTACLRIVQLLLSRKKAIEDIKAAEGANLSRKEEDIKRIEDKIAKREDQINSLKKEIQTMELEYVNFKEMTSYRQMLAKLEEQKDKLHINYNELRSLKFAKQYIGAKIDSLSDYIENCGKLDAIVEAIQSLGAIYKSFEASMHGNIAMLVALVYYSILDRAQLNAFLNWATLNGINKIVEPDDLSKDSSLNLITMFEQIFQSKKNEIFISMQFGDSQSELIYEKTVRAIEAFNAKHKTIHLNARPIRIDRTIESSTYSIQDKILDAIHSCSLIIADLSSANINVYHEIGYAMGVAKSNNLLPNMILLYKENSDHKGKENDIDKFVGFNLRNLSQLRFKDYKQLMDGLLERLEKHYGVN